MEQGSCSRMCRVWQLGLQFSERYHVGLTELYGSRSLTDCRAAVLGGCQGPPGNWAPPNCNVGPLIMLVWFSVCFLPSDHFDCLGLRMHSRTAWDRNWRGCCLNLIPLTTHENLHSLVQITNLTDPQSTYL